MAQLRSRRVNGNLVFYQGHRHRIVDAIGADVIKWELRPEDLGGSTVDPVGFTTTVVEVGVGTTEFSPSDTAGILGRITTAANENDGGSYQLLGENFELTANQGLVYAGIELALDDVTQSDLLFGLCVTDTALLGGVADGVYIEKLDGGATISTVTEKDSTETQTDSEGTMVDTDFHFLEIYYDGAADSVYYYFDGVQTSVIHTTDIPDNEALRLSLEFLNGDANAHTADIRQMRAIQVGRT